MQGIFRYLSSHPVGVFGSFTTSLQLLVSIFLTLHSLTFFLLCMIFKAMDIMGKRPLLSFRLIYPAGFWKPQRDIKHLKLIMLKIHLLIFSYKSALARVFSIPLMVILSFLLLMPETLGVNLDSLPDYLPNLIGFPLNFSLISCPFSPPPLTL